MDELLSIGRFARLSGLSVGALRHYHEVGLLEPARTDPQTSYRSYARSQLEDARLIARLRELGLGLPEIRAILGADPVERGRRLAAHRSRLMGTLARLQRQIHWLNQAIDHEEPIMTTPPMPPELDRATVRQLAAGLFNHTWTLIEAPDRTPMQDDEMIHAAHASRYHWGIVGNAANLNRGEWLCSRVYAILGRGEPALWHARRCLAICEEHRIGDWELAFAHEAIARAHRVAGDHGAADAEVAIARELGAAIAETEDRELLLGDLATV